MRFALYDAQGLPLSFFAEDIQGPRELEDGSGSPAYPAGVVEISDDAWQEFLANPGRRRWDGSNVVAYSPPAAALSVPDGPTLSDWRVAVTLWGRMADVQAKVTALAQSSDAATAIKGAIANERLQYANNVFRAELLTLKDALGFTAADVDESLWRADRVRQGDLSGVWPLAAS